MAMAIPSSEIGGSSKISGSEIQLAAARTNMASTSFSPVDMGPSLCSSSRMSSRPPGIRSISGLNSTLTSRNHAMAIITTARGTPTAIHWPKPMEMSWLSLR